MDTKIINAYNEKSQKRITSGLLIVDAALEPLRVLKVLMEGLGPDVRAGLWLTNFKGVPVARTLSPFDLVYLDKDYRVVHCVEISTKGEYAPFRGEPASALVLPAKTIQLSKTRPGDRLLFRAEDNWSIGTQADAAQAEPPAAAPAPPRASQRTKPTTPAPALGSGSEPSQPTHFFNAAFPVPPPEKVGLPLDQFLGARGQNGGNAATASNDVPAAAALDQSSSPRGSTPALSGRLTKTAKSVLGPSPSLRPPSAGDGGGFYNPRDHGATAPKSAVSGSPMERVRPAASATHVIQGHGARGLAAPPEASMESRSAIGSGMHSGRLMRGAQLAERAPMPELEPTEAQVAVQDLLQEATEEAIQTASAERVPAPPLYGVVIPITSAPVHAPGTPEPSSSTPAEAAAAANSLVPAKEEPQAPANRAAVTPAPAAQAPETQSQAAPPPTTFLSVFLSPEKSAKSEQPAAVAMPPTPQLLPSQLPAVKAQRVEPAVEAIPQISQPPVRRSKSAQQISASQSATPIAPVNDGPLPVKIEQPTFPRTVDLGPAARRDELALHKKKPTWDVRLLYTLFPEFDPSRPPEIRIPTLGDEKKQNDLEDEEPSLKLQVLSWLYPDLQLEKVKQKRSEERRAVRLPMPGLVAYFFTGGSPRPHPIKDISVTGFYMCTQERWLPGTIIRVTLQMIDNDGKAGRDSITVHSRVVRWGPDGGGFEFVLPGFLES